MNRLRHWLSRPAASQPWLLALIATVLVAAVAVLTTGSRSDGEPTMRPPNGAVEAPSPIIAPATNASEPAGDAARPAARAFLAGYLAFLYGRADATGVEAVTPAVRRELVASRLRIPPAQRQRRPQVVDLRLTRQAADAVLATASIDDGDVAVYPIVFTLDRAPDGRWRVSRLAND